MIKSIKLLLGANLIDCEIDDDTINACIELAKDRYYRGTYKFGQSREDSWILEYALANCKLVLGEARSKFEICKTNGEFLISIALERIAALETEIKL